MPATILVRSSLNIDEIVRVPHTVRPGETLASISSQRLIGGKGTNISVAAAQGLGLGLGLGMGKEKVESEDQVYLAGAIGSDGTWILPELQQRGVCTSLIQQHSDTFTGTAFIQVTPEGENSIVLRQGANFVSNDQLDDPSTLYTNVTTHHQANQPTIVLLHNEIPYEVTKAYIDHRAISSTDQQTPAILWNPSPMPSRDQLQQINWDGIDVLVINEGEAWDLLEAIGQQQPQPPTSTASAPAPASAPVGQEDHVVTTLRSTPQFGSIPWIVLTRGSRGLVASIHFDGDGDHRTHHHTEAATLVSVAAAKVNQVMDTTGAGDTFTGYLAAAIARTGGIQQLTAKGQKGAYDALAFASLAAALAVERSGAMSSIPTLAEVQARWQDKS